MKKRLLTIVFALVMTFSCMPVVHADDATITTYAQLKELFAEGDSRVWKLGNDIAIEDNQCFVASGVTLDLNGYSLLKGQNQIMIMRNDPKSFLGMTGIHFKNSGTAGAVECNMLVSNNYGKLSADDNVVFNGSISNNGYIQGGQYNGSVYCNQAGYGGVILSGTFNGYISGALIEDGTFNGKVENCSLNKGSAGVKVTFVDAEDDSILNTQTVLKGQSASAADPQRADDAAYRYKFAGWYTAKEGGSLVTDFKGTEERMYYAHWNKTSLAVSDMYKTQYIWTGAEQLDVTLPASGTFATRSEAESSQDRTYPQLTKKTGTDGYYYSFSGWIKSVDEQTKTITFNGQWKELKPVWSPMYMPANCFDIICESDAGHNRTITKDKLTNDKYQVSEPYHISAENGEKAYCFEVTILNSAQYYPEGHEGSATESVPMKFIITPDNKGVFPASTSIGTRIPGKYFVTCRKTLTWNKNADNSQLDMNDATTDANAGTVMIRPPANDPVYQGYIFDGWHTHAVNEGKVDFSQPQTITDHTVYYAHWKTAPAQDEKKIVIELPDKSTMDLTGYESGNSISWVKESIANNYSYYPVDQQILTFNNKKLEDERTLADYNIQKNNVINVSLKQYKIKWNANAADYNYVPENGTAEAPYGTVIQSPANLPTRLGFNFDGWYTETENGEKLCDNTLLTSDAVYYAHWTPSQTEPIIITTAEQLEHLTNKNDGGSYILSNVLCVTDSLTIFGKTSLDLNGHTINGDHITIAELTVTNGTIHNQVNIPVSAELTADDSVTFTGMIYSAGIIHGGKYQENVSDFDTKGTITGGTFYRQVSDQQITGGVFFGGVTNCEIDSSKVTVTFNDGLFNGAEEKQIISSGGTPSAPKTPVNTGYVFDGWYDQKEDGNKINPLSSVTSDATYYAHWRIRGNYTVHFNVNGGTPSIGDKTNVKWSDSILEGITNPVRKGYIFDHWSKDNANGKLIHHESVNFITYSDIAESDDVKEITAFANWKPITYTVVFNSNGAEGTVPSITTTYDTEFSLPSGDSLNREGYTFKGWNTKADGSGTAYTAGTNIKNLTEYNNEEVTLYAVWIKKDSPSVPAEPDPVIEPAPSLTPTEPTLTPSEPPAQIETVDTYRLYNSANGQHLFTVDLNEYNFLQSHGWIQEGTGWNSAKEGNTAVYRLYNPWLGEHLFTTDKNEYSVLVTHGWKQEGIAFYSDDAKGIEVYRLYNPYNGQHHFTADANEYNVLPSYGWKREGIAWYGCK